MLSCFHLLVCSMYTIYLMYCSTPAILNPILCMFMLHTFSCYILTNSSTTRHKEDELLVLTHSQALHAANRHHLHVSARDLFPWSDSLHPIERKTQAEAKTETIRKKYSHPLLFRMEHVLALKSIQFLSNGKERTDKNGGLVYFHLLASSVLYAIHYSINSSCISTRKHLKKKKIKN